MSAKAKKTAVNSDYNADSIVNLDDVVLVQSRIGIYLGDHPRNTALREIIDNGVDEVRAKHGNWVRLTLFPDGSRQVEDNGRGIPTGINSKTGDNGIIMCLGRIGSGGKYTSDAYQSSGSTGMNGMGAAATCFTSARLTCTVYRNNKKHVMEFRNGKPGHFAANDGPDDKFTPSRDIKVSKDDRPADLRKLAPTGTTIRFWENPVLFPASDELNIDQITELIKFTSFLVPGLHVDIVDARDENNVKELTFDHDGGVHELLGLVAPNTGLHDVITFSGVGSYTQTVRDIDGEGDAITKDVVRKVGVDVALQWNSGYEKQSRSFANTIYTPLGGSHVQGAERALLDTMRDKISSTRGLLKNKEEPPVLDDMLEGLTYVVSVTQDEPPFIGQDKQRLKGNELQKVVRTVVGDELTKFLDARKNAEVVKLITTKIVNASRNRQTLRAQKEVARRKTALKSASMPSKLVDCASPNTEFAELFICEGDSALGTLKDARDSNYQALLPIRGKILNAQKANITECLKNKEISEIIQVIGAGVGQSFDVDQMRVNKVIVAADADVDGAHIAALLITMFYRLMPQIVEAGRLYVAVPPLYVVKTGPRGDTVMYAENDIELNTLLASLAKKKTRVSDVKRLKGLGEMQSEDFWQTTLNPETRTLRQITMHDADAASSMVNLAMGKEVPPRKEWIMNNRHLIAEDDLNL